MILKFKDGLCSECHNQILVIAVLLVVFYVVGLSCAESQCFERLFYPVWSIMFFFQYWHWSVSIIDLTWVILQALLGLYKVWVLQFINRALDFHTRIWSRIEISNSLVTKSPYGVRLIFFDLIIFVLVNLKAHNSTTLYYYK